jgi:glycosyltransferase involved in cell wall biosynthesis
MTASAASLPRSDPQAERPSSRTLRLAVFSYGLPCEGSKRGGIEQVAHDLANALVDRGHSVTVFTYDPRPRGARYNTAEIAGRRLATTWLGRRITMGYLGNVLALTVDYRPFDAIITHGDSLLLPLAGKPVVRIMHGSALEEARTSTSIGRALLQSGVYVQELLTAWMQRATVGVSRNTRRFNPFIRHVIPNGIDLAIFHPEPARRSPRPSLLFVGALRGRKRGRWLLELFDQVIRPAVPEAQLHMVSTAGPAVHGVTYHEGISTEALVRLYQSAWLYVSPSTYEGFGMPYVEALACGTPVVATPNPGSREVLEGGRLGRLVPDDQFGETVCALLADERARHCMAHAGLSRVEAYDIKRSAQSYEALLLGLTSHD